MTFDIFRRLSLDFLGEEWKDCYLKFSYLTADEAKAFAGIKVDKNSPTEDLNKVFERAIKILEDKFVEGKGIRDKQIVDIKKEDLKEFPVEILNKSVECLVGSLPEGEKKEPGEANLEQPSGN